MHIRPADPNDLNSLYEISLATGHLGTDASHLYDDPKMIGYIYAAPYLKFSPDLCFVAVDQIGIAGFAVGTADTRSFERCLEENWWPALRAAHMEPDKTVRANWNADHRRRFQIHHPEIAPEKLVVNYPAHLHMNLLPRLQGQGAGPELLNTWLEKCREFGVTGVHVRANRLNRRVSVSGPKITSEPSTASSTCLATKISGLAAPHRYSAPVRSQSFMQLA